MKARKSFPTPALDAWRAELRDGGVKNQLGPLWRAACWEAAAAERHRLGNLVGANSAWDRAKQIIRVAARGTT